MIQRIQTVYLFIILILMGQTFFFPFVSFFDAKETISFNALNFNNGELILPLAILTTVILLVSFVSILLFKRRFLQIRLTLFNLILLIGYMGLLAYLTWHLNTQKLEGYNIKYNFTCIYPLVCAILSYLAMRGVKKDDKLIRSADRIR